MQENTPDNYLTIRLILSHVKKRRFLTPTMDKIQDFKVIITENEKQTKDLWDKILKLIEEESKKYNLEKL